MQDNHDLQDFLFDLRGYLILPQAVKPDLIERLNCTLDPYLDMEYLEWRNNIQRFDNNGYAGIELQNIVEANGPFAELIDHPSWIGRLQRYCGENDSYVHGLFIDECFASVRRKGGYFPMHSGNHDGVVRNQYRYVNGKFRCGQVNILLALTDIGPGDGGTCILPGSHKSNFAHPVMRRDYNERAMDKELPHIDGSLEVHLKKGDALLFVDALCHGATSRTNPGDRRVVIYRYGPTWGNTRHGYRYSDELLASLTPERKKILQPITPRVPIPALI